MENYLSSSSYEDDDFFNVFLQATSTMFDVLSESLNAPHRSGRYLNRDRKVANKRLLHHDFVDDCLYDDDAFKHYFRLSRNLFIHIANHMKDHYKSFQLR